MLRLRLHDANHTPRTCRRGQGAAWDAACASPGLPIAGLLHVIIGMKAMCLHLPVLVSTMRNQEPGIERVHA